jgi:DNA repair protein RecO (recombination protein O)
MKTTISTAIILHHTNYGEADKIVTFLTSEHGRMKGFARSARKSRKRFGPALEPFAEVQLHWTQRSSSDLTSLRAAELVNLRVGLRRDLETLTLAGYGCELAETLFDESGASADLFHLLQAFLDHLDSDGFSPDARLLIELRLLALAGYMPHLQHCAACFGPLQDGPVGFSAASDGSLCAACGGSKTRLKVDRMTLGSLGRILQIPLTRFSGFNLSPRSRQEGFALLADALQCHLPRPLKSQAFIDRLDVFRGADEGG